jgi:hypothetical protein
MRIPFIRRRIDWSDPQQLRQHATTLTPVEGAWPLRGNGKLPSSEELMAELEDLRRFKAAAHRHRPG